MLFLLLVYLYSFLTHPYPIIPFNNPNDSEPTINPANNTPQVIASIAFFLSILINDAIKLPVHPPVPGSGIPTKELLDIGIEQKSLNFFEPPHQEDIDKLDPIYLSYFLEWSSFDNYQIAKKYGFHDLTHEWIRTHHVEQFDQVDTPAYLVHSWMKYPKFGHASATDYSARMVRYGMLTREEAIQLVKKHDHDLDPRSVREFCQFFGYSEKEFWKIIDNHYNKDIFEQKTNGAWEMKNPIWKEKK